MLRSEARERQADFGMHLNLVDAFELIFDRVFGRDDLGRSFLISNSALYSVVVLPEPVGPGDQHDAVRHANQLAEMSRTCPRSMPMLLEVELHAALVEDTHDDAFAVDHRNDRHADVDLAAATPSA